MPEQKIILSVIGQVLDGTNDEQLLKFIGMVNQELDSILLEFSPTKELPREVTAVESLPVYGQSSDMASNQVRS